MKKSLFSLFVILAMGACGAVQEEADPIPTIKTIGLQGFDRCDALHTYLKRRLGQERPADVGIFQSPDGASAAPAEDGASATQADSAPAVAVEEADIVKRQGKHLFVAGPGGGVLLYDLSSPNKPKLIENLATDLRVIELYAEEDRVIIIGQKTVEPGMVTTRATSLPIDYQNPQLKVEVWKIETGHTPRRMTQWSFDGSYSDSRKVGSAVYLAIHHSFSLEDFQKRSQDFSDCSQVLLPEAVDFGGYGYFHAYDLIGLKVGGEEISNQVASQLTLLGPWDSQMTASPQNLYFTNRYYQDDETGVFVFRLDAVTARLAPLASRTVPGRLVNQFSMDEFDGHFRIATTTNRSTFGADDNRNYMTVFKVAGDLTQVGQNGEIMPGESITAVRFMDDLAYLTTYVTKDPLVTLDLSDPTQPKVLGELDVPGFPTHLHAWGEDRLISIGSTEEWGGKVMLSLLDVSDLEAPQLIQQITLENTTSSEAQYEHRAFTFFAERSILAIPVSEGWGQSQYLALYWLDREKGFFFLGKVDHRDLFPSEDFFPPLRRSLEVEGLLYTVSEAGLEGFSFENFYANIFSEKFPGAVANPWRCYDFCAEPAF